MVISPWFLSTPTTMPTRQHTLRPALSYQQPLAAVLLVLLLFAASLQAFSQTGWENNTARQDKPVSGPVVKYGKAQFDTPVDHPAPVPATGPGTGAIDPSGRYLVTSFRGQSSLFVPEGSIAVQVATGDSLVQTLVQRTRASGQYIVEFTTPPLARQIPQGQPYAKAAGLPAMREAARRIRQEHERFRQDLRRLEAEKDGRNQGAGEPEAAVRLAYEITFNGMALTADPWIVERVRKLPYVKAVHRDTEVKALLDESVAVIGADRIWSEYNITGSGMVVAILDTGIDYLHPDLGGGMGPGFKVLGGYDFVNDDGDPMDDHGHGTHVAGIVAANGQLKGVAPDASLVGYKVLHAEGYGYASWIVGGIEQCVIDGVDVMNASIGGPGSPDDPMAVAIDNASLAGVVCVVAAGNAGPGYYTVGSPGVAARAITVGATDLVDEVAHFSSRGPVAQAQQIKPDVLAPGVLTNSTMPGGWHERMSGTSMASPHVAGAVALFLNKYPEHTPEQVKSVFSQTALDLGLDIWTQGSGRIDLPAAFERPAFLVSPNKLGLGMVVLSEDVWEKTDTLFVHNISEQQQAFHVSVGQAFPEGVSLSYTPADFSLHPGKTEKVLVRVALDNRVTGFPDDFPAQFAASLRIQAGTSHTTVPLVCIKSPGLRLVFDVEPEWVIGFAAGGKTTGFIQYQGTDFFIPLSQGVWELAASFDESRTFLLLEDVEVNDLVTLHLSKGEAKNTLSFESPDIRGNAMDNDMTQVLINFPASGFFLNTGYMGDAGNMHFNDFTKIELEYTATAHADSADHVYAIAHRFTGMASDRSMTYQPGELFHYPAQYPPPEEEILLRPVTGVGTNHYRAWVVREHPESFLSAPYVVDYYLSPGFRQSDPPFVVSPQLYRFREVPFRPQPEDLYFQMANMSVGDDGLPQYFSWDWYPFDPLINHLPGKSAFIRPSLGPPAFNGRVSNWPGDNFILSNPDRFFLSQLKGYDPAMKVHFRFLRNGEEIRSGDFFETYPIRNYLYVWFETEPGPHLMEFSLDSFLVAGRQGKARVRLGFDPGEDAGVFPSLASLNLQYRDGYYTDQVGKGEPAILSFDLHGTRHEPGGQTVSLHLRPEHTTEWIALTLQEENSRYTAEVSATLDAGYVDLLIEASDGRGGTLEYLLEPAFLIGEPSPPEVHIQAVETDIHEAAARVLANVSSDGGSMITGHGIVWGPDADPTTENHLGMTSRGAGLGPYREVIGGLEPHTPYHVRAWAANSQGTAYSEPVLLEDVPSCVPPRGLTASHITLEEAEINWGTVDGGVSYDICFGPPGFDPQEEGTMIDGVQPPFLLTGLKHSTTYHATVRAQCGEEASPWSQPLVFTTECGPLILSFIYPESGQVYNASEVTDIPFGIGITGCLPVFFSLNIVDEYGQESLIEYIGMYEVQPVYHGLFEIPASLPGREYRFLIRHYFEGEEVRLFSEPFLVINEKKAIELFRPFDIDYWLAGHEHPVAWNAINVDFVDIMISLDQGESWEEIAMGVTSNTGYTPHGYNWHSWTAGNIPQGDHHGAVVRIACAEDPDTFGQSEPFTVSTFPPFTLLSPNPDTTVGVVGKMEMVVESRIQADIACMLLGEEGFHQQMGLFRLEPGPNTLFWEADGLQIGHTYTIEMAHLLITTSVWGGVVIYSEPFVAGKATPAVTWPEAAPIGYGAAVSSCALSGGQAMAGQVPVEGHFELADPDLIPPSGWYQVAVLFVPVDEDTFYRVAGYIPLLVNPRTLHLGGSFTVADKEYDGTTAATLIHHELVLQNVLPEDEVSPGSVEVAFLQAQPGENIPVHIRSVQLDGSDAPHYDLSLDGAPTALANILGDATHAGEVPVGTFAVYPNPARTALTVRAEPGQAILAITLYNLLGQAVACPWVQQDNLAVIDVSGLEEGLYVVRLFTDYGSAGTRIRVVR